MSQSPKRPQGGRMPVASARAATYSVVALLAFAALRYTPTLEEHRPGDRLLVSDDQQQLPRSQADVDEPRYAATQSAPVTGVTPRSALAWQQRVDTLGRGETLAALLERRGLRGEHARDALRAMAAGEGRSMPAGMEVTIGGTSADSVPTDVTLRYALDRVVHLHRDASGRWTRREVRLPSTVDTVALDGTITSSLYGALDAAQVAGGQALPRGARHELAWTLADIFEYRVDMSRDLQRGDSFRVLVERSVSPSGAVKLGRVLAAAFTLSGDDVEAVRYESRGSSATYFDGRGKSLRAAFLRAPVEFRRISSNFGFRLHPILGVWRQHKGTDYAASQGTPVRSIGDGVVVFAGQKHGYGNVVDVRHRNGYVSRYGHLRGFARGVRTGARVNVGQTIAYVGMTGLATAPHLHFEMLVGGVQRDSRVVLRQLKGGEPIPSGERGAFERTRARLLASIDAHLPGQTRVVAADQ
ncbi:MAG TPA: M23 family metallopeptidase [Gemmatimonadaceae bacterium]|nr:M23 family metallopeptidase [Gemmatimonadaceae bacterium]